MTLIRVCLLLAACSGNPDKPPGQTSPTNPPTDENPTQPTDPSLDTDGDGVSDVDDCAPDDATQFPGAPDRCGDDQVTDCTRTSDDGLVTVAGVFTTPDLAEALSSASAGDEVLVCPGVYAGPFVVATPVVLRAHGSAADTTLSGESLGSTLEVVDGTTIDGFTISGGNAAAEGGGVHLPDPGALTIVSCAITTNQAEDGGGIAVGAGAILTLVDTEIVDNDAANLGGGLLLGDGASVSLENTSIRENHAEIGGGGMALGTDTVVDGGDVSDNLAGNGAGLYVTGDALLADCVVHDNAARNGGGVWLADGTLTLSGETTIAHNTATGDGGGFAGERATLQGGSVVGNLGENGGGSWIVDGQIRGTVIADNEANLDGGGVHATCAPGGPCTDTVLVDCELVGNSATGKGGGAWVTRTDGEEAVFEHDTFSGNGASSGGGLYVESTHLTLVDAVFEGNNATDGGGITLSESDATVSGTTIRGNVATAHGGGVLVIGATDLSSSGSDWGEGADDNDPSDLHYLGVPYSFTDTNFGCHSPGGCD